MSTADLPTPPPGEPANTGPHRYSGIQRRWVVLGGAVALLLVLLTGTWIQQTRTQNHKMEVLQAQQESDRAAAAKLQATAAAESAARVKAAAAAAAAADSARVDAAIAKARAEAAEAKAQAKKAQESTVVIQQPSYYGYYDDYGYYHYH